MPQFRRNYKNAVEDWPLFDTIMIANNVDTLYKNAGWYAQYSDLAAPATIPVFNVRNRSVGVQYCNFDSANKMPFVYHVEGIGIEINAPLINFQSVNIGSASGADVFFANDLKNHMGFILRVSQDEKLVCSVSCMPAGGGISGWATRLNGTATGGTFRNTLTTTNGLPMKDNTWVFPQPVTLPREVNIEGQIVLSPYARKALARCLGPGNWRRTDAGGTDYPQAATIVVKMEGVREVQQRNELHYAG